MAEHLDVLNTAVSLLIRAVLLAAVGAGFVSPINLDCWASSWRPRRCGTSCRGRSLRILPQPHRPPRKRQKRSQKPARFPPGIPNHVWPVDTTKVRCWGLWTIHVLVAIDHFARKVVCVAPLEGPNAGWIIVALEQAMRKHGAPKHIISDQASVFTGGAFAAYRLKNAA